MHLVLTFLLLAAPVLAASSDTPKQGAALLKTDILGVFAHPDDETGMAATLAYYSRARQSVVANVYCTRGEGGGNMVGTQWGAALGALREAELRDCLGALGVRYCYFLDRLDWAYTESLAATLENWNKEQTLERLVRLVRALRPEVIVTMNPAPTPGQHGHHQAAGVLATEAFAAAADPNRFPLQISKEGLAAWQARRLFYGGARSNEVAATIAVNEPLPDGRTPAQIAGAALANHRSQAFGNFADSPWLRRPQSFALVKDFVANDGVQNDMLAGLPADDSRLQPVRFAVAQEAGDLELGFVPRAAFVRYRAWVREHAIEHVASHFQPDLPLVSGAPNNVQLEITNRGAKNVSGVVRLLLPPAWRGELAQENIDLTPGETKVLTANITPPADASADEDLSATFRSETGRDLRVSMKAHPVPSIRVPRARSTPVLDGSGAGWEDTPTLEITPAQRVQGQVTDFSDSSATVHLAQDGKTLFVDVLVRDDVLVTNIAPNDIRGHWRSDSVEICLAPTVGAEHTMGCYKIGIFPSDSSGQVRAARDADANQGPIEETAPGTRITSRRTPDGYRIQAAIPFAEIGLKPAQKNVGFNVIIYDGDKADAAPGENINKSRLAWVPRPGVQGRPEDWGRIELE